MSEYNDNLQYCGNKRYVHIMWDGFLDRKTREYLDDNEIEKLLNINDNYYRIWLDKYDEVKHENKLLKDKVEYLEGLLRKHNLEGYK